jgi:cyclophilin family peptidyl-prolyl cis-trans isomerase
MPPSFISPRKWSLVLIIAIALVISACSSKPEPTTSQPAAHPSGENKVAVIETSAGTIKIELLASEAPKTAENFKELAEQGRYDGTVFHRVQSGFMIQGGDPKGDGSGGQTATGRPLPNEVNPASPLYQGGYKRGIVAMANVGGRPETGSSQFFIMHKNTPLPAQYTVFGRVLEGMDTVDKIAAAPNEPGKDRPVSPVRMNKVYVQ